MKNCHECDSEVADNDIFCPYCGISMQSVAVETASSDDAFSSTIVISSPVAVPDPVRSDPAVAEPEAPEPSAIPLFDDTSDDNVDVGATVDTIDKAIETSLPIIESGEPKDISTAEELQEDVAVESLESYSLVASDDVAAVSEADEDVAEEPRLAERLTGAIGSISGRFAHPTDSELAEVEAAVETQADEEGDEFAVSEPVDVVEDDLEKAATVEGIDISVSDVPTPILLSSDEIDSTVEKLGETALDAGEIDIAMPEDSPVVEETEVDPYHTGNAVIPAIMHAMSDPVAEIEFGAEIERSEVPELESGTGEVIEQPGPLSLQMADAQEVFTSPETKEEQAEEDEATIPTTEEPLAQAIDTSDGLGDDEPSVPVTDEPLQHTVADTGDGLSDAETNGGTTPNIGSTDTDGRKSGLKPLSEGTVLNNRYDIVRKIGGGGMGAVYLANDRNLGGVQRAVKEMVQSHIEEEQQEKAVEDFKRESTILSTLDHPSIPTIYDYFFDAQEGRFYLVMKYISGGDLAGKLRATPEGRIDERTVCEWALQIIDVLDYLHNLPTKIVYRDLKPSNVMIDGNTGRIMLIDFGIARSINQNQEKGVTAVGTMGYAPPELFSGNVEPRSDIYSLGSTMFHLLTGADPQNNPLLIFDFQKNPRPRQINPQLSDQIERILMRSVEYNADARFESAAEMKHALAAHIDNLKTGQITYGVTEVPQSVSLSHQIVFCGFCGQRIVATDMFCAFCGSKQPLAQQGVHREVYSPAVGTARLVIEGTSDLTAPAYGLEKNENLVGRRDPMSNIFPEVDLSKYDPQTKISRRHAKIWRDGGNYLVEDLGSSNGTLLLTQLSDTMRLMPHQPHPIASGDRIRIGDTTLQFIVG